MRGLNNSRCYCEEPFGLGNETLHCWVDTSLLPGGSRNWTYKFFKLCFIKLYKTSQRLKECFSRLNSAKYMGFEEKLIFSRIFNSSSLNHWDLQRELKTYFCLPIRFRGYFVWSLNSFLLILYWWQVVLCTFDL